MPTPTPYAIGAEWQTNGSADFLHLKDKGGTIIGWIDKDGFLQGTLANGGGSLQLEVNGTPNVDQSLLNLIAGSNIMLTDDGLGGITIASSGGGGGNGFASGTTVANSIGNTPADGFTLSNGSGDTNTQSPSDINLGSTGNPGVIDLNSEGSPTVTIGNGATVGTSTILSRLTPSSIGITGGAPTITLTDTAGDVAELQSTELSITNINGPAITLVTNSTDAAVSTADSSGNHAALGAPNGAGLILTGAGGTSITEDGTVPSTTWSDGAGNTTVVSLTGITVTDSVGDTAAVFVTPFSPEFSVSLATGETGTLAPNAIIVEDASQNEFQVSGTGIFSQTASTTDSVALNGSTSPSLVLTSNAGSVSTITPATASFAGTLAIPTPGAPATSASAGVAGQIAWDSTHIYVAVAVNTWVRALLTTF